MTRAPQRRKARRKKVRRVADISGYMPALTICGIPVVVCDAIAPDRILVAAKVRDQLAGWIIAGITEEVPPPRSPRAKGRGR